MERNNDAFSPDIVTCPACDSSQVSKSGTHRGKQRYLCKDCKRQFQETISSKGNAIPDEVRAACTFLYIQGANFNEIERQMGVCHTTLSRWFKNPPSLTWDELLIAVEALDAQILDIEPVPIDQKIILYKAATIKNGKPWHVEPVSIENAVEEGGFFIEETEEVDVDVK